MCHLAPPAHPLPLLCLTADQEQEQAEEEALALAGGKIGSPVHGQKKESHEGNSGIKLNKSSFLQKYKSLSVHKVQWHIFFFYLVKFGIEKYFHWIGPDKDGHTKKKWSWG